MFQCFSMGFISNNQAVKYWLKSPESLVVSDNWFVLGFVIKFILQRKKRKKESITTRRRG